MLGGGPSPPPDPRVVAARPLPDRYLPLSDGEGRGARGPGEGQAPLESAGLPLRGGFPMETYPSDGDGRGGATELGEGQALPRTPGLPLRGRFPMDARPCQPAGGRGRNGSGGGPSPPPGPPDGRCVATSRGRPPLSALARGEQVVRGDQVPRDPRLPRRLPDGCLPLSGGGEQVTWGRACPCPVPVGGKPTPLPQAITPSPTTPSPRTVSTTAAAPARAARGRRARGCC